MRRFEFNEGTSSKFWEIDVEGSGFTVRYGRIGSEGQTQTKSFASDDKAKSEADKLVKEKSGKGYVETVSAGSKPATATPKVTVAAPKTATVEAPVPAGTVRWTDEARSKVLPRPKPTAGRPVVYVPPRAERLERVARGLEERVSAWKAGEAKASADIATLLKASRAALEAGWETFAKLPVDAAAIGTLMLSGNLGLESDLATLWVEDRGLAFAVQLLGVARGMRREEALNPSGTFKAMWFSRTYELFATQWNPPAFDLIYQSREPLRSAAADVSAIEYAKARDLAAAMRRADDLWFRCVLSFIFAAEHDWAKQDAETYLAKPVSKEHQTPNSWFDLVSVLRDVELARRIASQAGKSHAYAIKQGIFSLVGNVGVAAVPVLAVVMDNGDNRTKRDCADALFLLECDEAVTLLANFLEDRHLGKDVAQYCERIPEIAARALTKVAASKSKAASSAGAMLRKLAAANPQLAGTASTATATAPGPTTDASAASLPRVLASPPWLSKTPRKPPAIVQGVEVAKRADAVAWGKGERERASGPAHHESAKDIAGHLREIESRVKEHAGPHLSAYIDSWWYAVKFTDDALLEAWKRFPRVIWRSNTALMLIARLGEKILPGFIDYAVSLKQPTTSKVLLPVVSTRVAQIMADGFAGRRSRSDAETWLRANPEVAAQGIIPVAVGKPGTSRDNAAAALRFLVGKGHDEIVRKVAGKYGAAVEKAVAEALASDPSDSFPEKLPKLPEFLDPQSLPRPLLANGKGSLPLEAVTHLATMLAFSTPEAPYAGLATVKEACDAASLEAFAWGLYEAWSMAGAPSKEQWAFLALGHLGSDAV
ncbi:MAG: WGR domain-containing protein, partial [Deltaproteobacteria bacterium]